MMRITNAMMTSNTKNNINLNKLNEDRLNTQIATGQVISRPSEDPVVAIRALRLNTNLSQLNQYYKKNIPDAQAWLNVTETALKQTDQIFTNIKENLTTGASDTNTASDRQKLLESLKGLRAELYSSGNADYAERTVFTDYRTQESLTFLETDAEVTKHDGAWDYQIHETFGKDSIENFTYVSTYKSEDTSVTPAIEPSEAQVEKRDLKRIKLAYDNLNETEGPDPENDPKYVSLVYSTSGITPLKIVNISGKSQEEIDKIYMNVLGSEGILIPETGEIILGEDAAVNYTKAQSQPGAEPAYLGVHGSGTSSNPMPDKRGYNKNEWKAGDLRPEHYFACTETNTKLSETKYYNYKLDPTTGKPDTTNPDFQNRDMVVEISFNQKITINTHANEVYTHDIGRDIDELIRATQDVVDVEDRVTALEKKLAAAAETDKPAIQKELDAANKEFSLKKDKMQKMFSQGLDTFAGYADRNNLAIANIGSMQSRLSITKERVADQLQSFKELADDNINAELTESSIDFANAKLALEAAQLAAGKIAQQTLLNYL